MKIESLLMTQMLCLMTLSKADGHKIVLEYASKGLDARIIHPTSIVGPNDFKPGIPMQALVDMANGKRKLMPNWGYNFVDVRIFQRQLSLL